MTFRAEMASSLLCLFSFLSSFTRVRSCLAALENEIRENWKVFLTFYRKYYLLAMVVCRK